MVENNLYEERVVLFLDILNFKNLVGSTLNRDGTDDSEKICYLRNVLKIIRETLAIDTPVFNTSKKITQFSDSIVISFEIKERGSISDLILDIHFLVKRLVMQNVLCRGGIAYGKLIHDDKFIFGPGLITAYYAESKAALYPRIIFDKTILQYAGIYNNNQFNNPQWELAGIFTMVSKDNDEMFYIDYIEKGEFGSTLIGTTRINYITTLKQIIELGLEYSSPDLKVKYGWMQNKYNKVVDSWKKRAENSSLSHDTDWLDFVAKMEKIK
jgi:hypothetical protein